MTDFDQAIGNSPRTYNPKPTLFEKIDMLKSRFAALAAATNIASADTRYIMLSGLIGQMVNAVTESVDNEAFYNKNSGIGVEEKILYAETVAKFFREQEGAPAILRTAFACEVSNKHGTYYSFENMQTLNTMLRDIDDHASFLEDRIAGLNYAL